MCSTIGLLQSTFILSVSIMLRSSAKGDLIRAYRNIWEEDKCPDKYEKYCDRLKPHQCYMSYNRNLCCNTCQEFTMHFGVYPYDNIFCDFGDRKVCSDMDSHLCYKEDYRKSCCATCKRAKLNIPNCEFGDLDIPACMKVKSHDCYKPEVAKTCCGTCSKYSTRRKGCEYGDKVKMFSKYKKWYNCIAYIGHFGTSRCFFDKGFMNACCGSCYKKSLQWSYTYG